MRADRYRQYSFDFFALANKGSNPRHRALMLDMSQAWMKLADQADSLRHRPYAHHLTLVSDRSTDVA
jgi:hypothetical protein